MNVRNVHDDYETDYMHDSLFDFGSPKKSKNEFQLFRWTNICFARNNCLPSFSNDLRVRLTGRGLGIAPNIIKLSEEKLLKINRLPRTLLRRVERAFVKMIYVFEDVTPIEHNNSLLVRTVLIYNTYGGKPFTVSVAM